jgi:hypothetical protein
MTLLSVSECEAHIVQAFRAELAAQLPTDLIGAPLLALATCQRWHRERVAFALIIVLDTNLIFLKIEIFHGRKSLSLGLTRKIGIVHV